MAIAIRRILVPTDFSETANEAQQYAMALAEQFHAQLHLLHVVPLPMPTPRPSTPWITAENEMKLQIALAEQRLAEGTKSSWFRKHAAKCTAVMGFEVQEILRYSKANKIDLIVIGTHGRSGLSHFVLGSVAEKIVRMATCPVLSVHPKGHQFVLDEMAESRTAVHT